MDEGKKDMFYRPSFDDMQARLDALSGLIRTDFVQDFKFPSAET